MKVHKFCKIVKVLPFLGKRKAKATHVEVLGFVFPLTSTTKLEKFSEEPYKCVNVNRNNFRVVKALKKIGEFTTATYCQVEQKNLKSFSGGVADLTNPEATEVYIKKRTERRNLHKFKFGTPCHTFECLHFGSIFTAVCGCRTPEIICIYVRQ